MTQFQLTGGLRANQWRQDRSYTIRELEREAARRGLKIASDRRNRRAARSRRVLAVEPGGRVMARFDRVIVNVTQ